MKRTDPQASLLVARSALLATAAVCAVSSCERRSSEAPEVSELAGRFPEIAAMLEASRASPAERTADGFRLTPTRPAAEADAPSGWKTAAAASLQVEVDDQTADLLVRGPRAAVRVTHVGTASTRVEREGSTVVLRDAAGLRAMLFARATGVEELLVQDSDAATGYALEMPVGWSLGSPPGHRGLVEIRDSQTRPRLRISAPLAWDADGNRWPVTARVAGRQVRFEVPEAAAEPVVVDPEWQDTSSPSSIRGRAAVATLPDGRVMLVGGETSSTGDALCTSELYDPFEGTWEVGPSIPASGDDLAADACTTVMDAVAVPLRDGTILFAGGANRVNPDGSPHLVGANQPGAITSAWRYDPVTRTFTPTGPMTQARVHHTGTLLPSGKVLIAGGSDRHKPPGDTIGECDPVGETSCEHCVGLASAELYDPDSGTFTGVPMPLSRACHTAHLLSDGSVLLVGGGGDATKIVNQLWGAPRAELSLYRDGQFDTLATGLSSPRMAHISVLHPARNEVLVSLGRNHQTVLNGNFKPNTTEPAYALSEIIDLELVLGPSPPSTASPVACDPIPKDGGAGGAGGGAPGPIGSTCPEGRSFAAGTLTHDGQALLVGGQEVFALSDRVDVFDFATQAFESTKLPSPAVKPVLTTLANGATLVTGQTVPPRFYDTDRWAFSGEVGSMSTARSWHSVTTVPGGQLLVAGGQYYDASIEDLVYLDTAELFDPTTLTSTPLAQKMSTPRSAHAATYIPPVEGRGAKVLLTGGVIDSGGTPEAENFRTTDAADLYDPATKTFESVGPMKRHRAWHAATALPDGRVLIVGGTSDHFVIEASAEIYDPASGEFREIDPPSVGRMYQTATLIPSTGKVLIAGGYPTTDGGILPIKPVSVAEMFEPATETFRRLPDMVVPRGDQVAQVLPNGSVLLAAGSNFSTSAELFDPESETFRLASGAMSSLRLYARGAALPSGKVLISGGMVANGFAPPLRDAEVYDPLTEKFERVDPGVDSPGRQDHRAVVLPDGTVGLFGGSIVSNDELVTERVDILRIAGEPPGEPPSIAGAPSAVVPGQPESITGSELTSYWEKSTGWGASPTNFPLALWMPASGFASVGNIGAWSGDAATWTPRSSPFHGLGRLFVVRNGRLSSSSVAVELALADNGVACDSDSACASGFCSDGVCCNERCHVAGDPERVCRSCTVALGAAADGVCSSVAENTDPHLDCEESIQCAPDSATCAGDGQCKPCQCSSKVDCALGYTCTADGKCERPPRVLPEDGCSFAPPGDNGPARQGWWLLGIAVAGVAAHLRRRPRGVGTVPPCRLPCGKVSCIDDFDGF